MCTTSATKNGVVAIPVAGTGARVPLKLSRVSLADCKALKNLYSFSVKALFDMGKTR